MKTSWSGCTFWRVEIIFLRRLLSLFLLPVALGFVGVFVSVFCVRNLGDRCEVSQVFHLTQAVKLGGVGYIGLYNAAVTPEGKMAQICELAAWTPERYVNMLDHRVFMWPVDDPLFAYEESPRSRAGMWISLVLGLFLPIISYFLWKNED